jgi:hypothetical protein
MAAFGSKRQSDEKKGAEGALLHSVGGTVFGELGPELRRPASAIAHRTELQSHMRSAQAATSHCAIINMGPEDVAVRGACVAVRRTGAAQLSTEHSGVDDSARVQKD